MIIKEKLKKFGVPLLAGLVVLGSVGGFAGTKAFAASQQTTQPAKQEVTEQTPAYKASIFLGQQDNGKDESKDKAAEEKNDAALASKAKISGDEAVKAVKAAYPDNTIQGAVLGDENGYLIYEVKMTDKAGKNSEVKVDAGNAKILASDNSSEEGIAEENDKNDTKNEQKDGTEKESQGLDNDNVEVEE
jgi:uncharacterized membrane protein YkoI